MEAQASKPTNPILIIACIAVILFCTVCIGALMGWIATSIANDEAELTADAPAKAATPTSAPAPVPEKHHASSPRRFAYPPHPRIALAARHVVE